MTLPDGKAGKALALGFCGLLLLTVGLVVVQPLVAMYGDMRDEWVLLDAQRARLLRLEAGLPALQTHVADLRQQRQSSEDVLLLPDTNDSVAAAGLQARVKTLSESMGAGVSSVESLAPQRHDGFRRISIRMVLTCDQSALTSILNSLASARPSLFVDNLEIRQSNLAAQQPDDAAPSLSVSFDVYGYRADDAQAADSRE